MNQSKYKRIRLSAAIAAAMALGNAAAAEKMPSSMKEMWKIIQQQQKEIEALKAAKAAPTESLAQEAVPSRQAQPAQAVAAQPAAVAPAASSAAPKAELERKTDVLAGEVEKIKTQMFIPETREYKSQYGLGPAASNVYRVNRGLSIGGYGEAMYTNYANTRGDSALNKDKIDLQRMVLYVGYKFNDWIILNNEIEFEHASSGEGAELKGEVGVEFSQLDFLLNQKYNLRAGLMLVPMGFINEIHEPVTFHGNYRPDVERYIIPTTWREMGGGVFGEILPGLQYRMYAMNGLNAAGFGNAGLHEGTQGGSNAKAEDFAFSGRVDYTTPAMPGWLAGASTFLGNSGQKDLLSAGQRLNMFTQLYEGHLQYRYRGLELRALGAYTRISNTAALNQYRNDLKSLPTPPDVALSVVGKESFGWYVEAAHDIMPFLWQDSSQYLAPFVRLERYNTLASVADGFDNSTGLDRWIYQAGLSYKPITNVVVKADYRNLHDRKIVPGGIPTGDEFNLGLGFIF